ncbi:hypothetical protein KGM_213610 [Danaus plexippus plexippus]|uniref:RNA helicase n=1 Tax=Danaus plexippus plexippus TaxID=278856 RepID=A0A212F400_DANPL|nr:hypothetical protein KGM_213610 [Danaus plexippus plexippus]
MLLSSNTLKGLKDSGFLKPSPIQLHGIPLGKCGFDLLLEAKSGTGKTAVFTVIALEKIDLKKGLQVVILAPTREIASQICDVLRQIGCHYNGLRIEVVMGGLPVQDDIEKFKNNNVHVVVGSPGRLRHLIQNKHIDILGVRLLVLDEADKLMEKSFLPDIKYIHMVLPKQKQVILSSATYPDEIKEYIGQFVQDPQHLCPNNNCVLLGVVQKITTVKYNSNIIRQTEFRFQELLKILTKKHFKQCLVFCNYQGRVSEVHKLLTKAKWPSEQLYGNQDQMDRLDAIKTLQEYKCRILISTDLAARGIDASNVDLVVNFEPPYEWQTYLHRIGRAGRFGSYGMAVTILSEGAEHKKFLNLLDSMKLGKLECFWDDDVIKDDNNKNLKGSENIIAQNAKCNKGNYKELWNILCGDDKVTNGEDVKLESFDELLVSLQNTKVESHNGPVTFHSLLDSFNNESPSRNLDVKYKNIWIPKEFCQNLNLSLAFNGEPLDNHMVESVTREIEEIKADNCNNDKLKLVLKESDKKNNSEVHFDSNLNSTDDLDHNEKDVMKNSSNIPERANITCNNDSVWNSNMEFEKLQLPTAFSNGKNIYSEKKISKKVKFPHTKKIIENISDFPGNSYKTTKMSSKKSEDSLIYNEDVNSNCNSKYMYKNKNRSKEDQSSKKIYNKNQSYENWYNQLKVRVKYFEAALYIEELSRM